MPLHIELSPPYSVNGHCARYQSLWMLARIYYAHRYEGSSLPIAAVQARFPGNANLRMMISRAFSDFASWGVAVGWGANRTMTPALLNPARRSRGPFWLDPPSAARMRITANGVDADQAVLASLLGMEAADGSHADSIDYAMRDVAYWNHLTQAMRIAQDGFAIGADAGVAQNFQAARQCALDGFQSILSVLKEGLAWRRYGFMDRSRESLNRLAALLDAGGSHAATPTFAAMAFIARAWDFYARRALAEAGTELERLALHPELHLVLRYNPRVRFEYLNLRALIDKTVAMRGKAHDPGERTTAAEAALRSLSQALEAAYEADSVDAAQHAAANIGLSLWLFWDNGLIDRERVLPESEVQMQALRWLGLSEWICDRFGVGGGSAWNTVFLLRIARGRCREHKPADLAQFRAQSPLTIAELIDATRPFHAPFSRAKGYTDWSSVLGFALDEHDARRVHYGPLQLANLLLEASWFYAFEQGLSKSTFKVVERLAALVPALHLSERRFFTDSMKTLPHELQSAAAEAAGSAMAKHRPTRRRKAA